nr:hypothetical protein [Tanacetum cinerariifolium]
MSTQQDIYAAGSENRPLMLNKDNYVPWSSRIIRYARSRPNGKMIVNSIENGPYVRRMIATLGEPDLLVHVLESFHEQTDEELTEIDIKQIDVDDQAIQTILLGLSEDVYADVDSCETAKEIWECVRQMMKGSDVEEQEKKAKLFNEGEKFTNQFEQYAGQVAQNQQGYNAWQNGGIQVAQNAVQNAGVQSGSNQNGLVVIPGIANQNGTGNVVNVRDEGDLDDIEEVNAKCILMANLQHASTSGTQLDKAPVYDTDGSAKVQLNDNCYDNEIFNMFTHKEQYTDLLEPIFEPQLVLQNDNHVTSVAPSLVQSGGTIETSFAPNEETRAHQETVYHNLVDQVAQVNMVNCYMRATNAELKFELARYKIQEQRAEISQEKYDKLEKYYQKSVYQEQCLTKKINALHLSSAKQITTLNDEISNLNKQLSKEKSSISSIMEEKKRLKHDFKTQEDKFLDKEVDLEAKIKDLENILLKKDQTVQTMHMLKPKLDLFYHPNQKMALEEHDPPDMYDSEETLELAQESREKMRFLEKEIKLANYAKIIHLEGLSDDNTLSVARKFLNEVKSSLVTLQRVVKQTMTLKVHNWSSSAHKELDRTNEKLELCIIKKEKEYAVLWYNWYTKCEECKYDKISYDKAYNDMQQKVERSQAQLRDLKGKSSNTPSASNTLDPLNQKLESKIVELEFQVDNYEREISHLKTTYKNLFDSITSNRAHAKLHNLIYENAQLRARVFENSSESMSNTSGTNVTHHVYKPKLSAVTPHSKKLHASMPSHFVPQPREFNVVKHRNVISPGMFKINLSQTSKVDLVPNKQSSSSIRTNPITNSQRHVTFKENVSSDTVTASSTGLVHTARTRRPQPKGNTRNVRVPSASKSSKVKKNVTVETTVGLYCFPRIKKPCHLNVITLSLLFEMINLKLSMILVSNAWLLLIMMHVFLLL